MDEIDTDEQRKLMLLRLTLEAAVPLWTHRLQHQPWSRVKERAAVCGGYVAEHGDVILYKSKKKGATADAFNHLAEGVACLSFSPGGVWIFGRHFEAHHPLAQQDLEVERWKKAFEDEVWAATVGL